ncbi:MAG: transposase, partial [Thermomicrobiales bacterium]
MNDTLIVTVYVILDDLLRAMDHRTDCRAQTSDSDAAQRAPVTVGVIAACQFANHHERALCILRALGYLSGPLSVSRFNRRFHALAHRLGDAIDLLAAALTAGTIFILDSVPLPVCRRVRAWRCKKVRGAEYCGYCAAKQETGALWAAFGWRLHLIITPGGIPASFDLLPVSYHDLTPVHELMERLPSGACVYADKGYNSADDEAWIEGETGIRLVPRRKENMAPNTLAETFALQRYRGRVETVNSQLAAWGV